MLSSIFTVVRNANAVKLEQNTAKGSLARGIKNTCFLEYFWQVPERMQHIMSIFEKWYPATARI